LEGIGAPLPPLRQLYSNARDNQLNAAQSGKSLTAAQAGLLIQYLQASMGVETLAKEQDERDRLRPEQYDPLMECRASVNYALLFCGRGFEIRKPCQVCRSQVRQTGTPRFSYKLLKQKVWLSGMDSNHELDTILKSHNLLILKSR